MTLTLYINGTAYRRWPLPGLPDKDTLNRMVSECKAEMVLFIGGRPYSFELEGVMSRFPVEEEERVSSKRYVRDAMAL